MPQSGTITIAHGKHAFRCAQPWVGRRSQKVPRRWCDNSVSNTPPIRQKKHRFFGLPLYTYVLLIHKSDITTLLQHMCRQGLLLSDGYGRGTRYRLTCNVPNTKIVTGDTNVDSLRGNVDSLDDNVDSLKETVNKTRLYNLSSQATALLKKKRLSQADMEMLISEIAAEWRTLKEFTEILEKDKSYLRNHVFPSLISKGILEREYPAIPNHPNQRYKLKQQI